MNDNWINHNTDKLILLFLVTLTLVFGEHILAHHPDNMQAFEWITGAFSTFAGALVMILTGRGPRADGQTANGLPPVVNVHLPPAPAPGAPAPTLPLPPGAPPAPAA